ncbi:MAG: glucose-6-phosphate dehydrogenase [Candidatus Promineifilaceae bacterium]|nr:glucose-6-phosphate dehydrogenase [Candidatus Promineifilaceae bacterium]
MSEITTIVIFGASGDLTKRKLIPALFDLFLKERLPEQWQIVGVSRSAMSDEEFRGRMELGVEEFTNHKLNEDLWSEFSSHVRYFAGDLSKLDDMVDLDQDLTGPEGDGPANRVYYLSVAPRLYESALENLGAADMVSETNGWRRVVIEKPFGHDFPSAKALNKKVYDVLNESQIYRIDHYLGKETVQNIMVFRFANSLFEPVWNRNHIHHVQITASETVDVGHRAGYYDGVGVVRDMMQNHMLQLLSLVAAEPPASLGAESLRNEKVKVLKAIRPMEPEEVLRNSVLGQYRTYRDAEGVATQSQTPTYAAIRFYIDNWRWQGVPFYLRSGKALAAKTTEIRIIFKEPPHVMFPMPSNAQITRNSLSICIQPDEGIRFSFQAKEPDTAADMRTVNMTFRYAQAFGPTAIPEAYERLLLDILKGDASLFTRGDAIELAWQLIDPIIEAWESEGAAPLAYFYETGSWGPVEADRLLAQDNAIWSIECHDKQR